MVTAVKDGNTGTQPSVTQSASTSKQRKLSSWSISERAVSVSRVSNVFPPRSTVLSIFPFLSSPRKLEFQSKIDWCRLVPVILLLWISTILMCVIRPCKVIKIAK